MRIVWNRDRYEFVDTKKGECYANKEELKAAGASWDNGNKTWWAPAGANLGRLRVLHPTISPEAMVRFEQEDSFRQQNIEASRATDSEIDIPSPPGLQYLGYQKAGIRFALRVFGDI
jgi:hypothetical protein